MIDPVSLLLKDFPYDPGKILASATGKAYVAIMLPNGQIGVCSTLNEPVDTDPMLLSKPDLNRADHRMVVTAFANAHINYLPENPQSGDIFDLIDFAGKRETVMIGYFPPLVEKFHTKGFPLAVFDMHKPYPDLTPADQMQTKLNQSECVILTATSLVNGTFTDIISRIKPGSEILMLGPSTPLAPFFKDRYRVTRLFGMIFKPYDFEILELISQGNGTQSFSKKSKKISL